MLLETRSLSKTYPIHSGALQRVTGSVHALRDVSIAVDTGETVAIVGGSGCGKSTLAKVLVRLLEADRGDILWEGQPASRYDRTEWSRRVQMIFQDPYASLNPKLSIGTQLAEVVSIAEDGLSGAQRLERCESLLKDVGLSSDALTRYPFQFSGGQRQRIAIARALALKPRLLIADEPLSALDVSIQAQMLELFRDLQSRLRLAMLMITHDLAVASVQADRIVVLESGRVVESGPALQVVQAPVHGYTQALLAAVPRLPC